jgi:arylsulfatase A-like enzyme
MADSPARLDDTQRAAWEAAYGPKQEAYARENPLGDELVRWKYQRYLEDYLGCIAAVDENIGRVLDYLDRSGLADSTLVVYTSDQGFFLGDHGWFDKRFMYEESLRMPLLVRFPGAIPAGSVNPDLVLNLDFGPTFLDLAGIQAPESMQGASLKALLLDSESEGWRKSVYYHYYEFPAVHMAKRHYGVRTARYKLIHFYHDIDAWELYDLEKDPNELHNVYADPAYSAQVTELKEELARLREQFGDSEELDREFLRQDKERRARR